MRRTILIFCFSLLFMPQLFAQQGQTPPPRQIPTPTAAPPGATAPTLPPPGIAPSGQQTPRPAGPPREGAPSFGPTALGTQNIQLAVTISDSFSSDVHSKKAITMLIVDGRSGQIRSMGGEGLINIDARPAIQKDGRILVQLTVEYRPDLSTEQAEALRKSGAVKLTMFTESLSLLVTDGKTVVASQSSDPGSDRKVALEITATIVK